MNDKEILYNILSRELDNLIAKYPVAYLFKDNIKSWVFNYIEPYMNFFMEGERMDVEMASSFVEEELTNKLAAFKAKFKEAHDNEENK